MGAWGPGLFSDDTACDARDEYRQCLLDGLEGAAATDKVLETFSSSLDDPDDGPPFWLGLAATQSKLGRLDDRVRERALRIMDDGSDLARFAEAPKLIPSRRRMLEKLRSQLNGPQRSVVRLRRPPAIKCEWEAGELVGVQCPSGEWVLLHVQCILAHGDIQFPFVCVLEIPFDRSGDADEATPVRALAQRYAGRHNGYFYLFLTTRQYKLDRFKRTGRRIPPRIQVSEPETFVMYTGLKGLEDVVVGQTCVTE